MSTTLNVTTEQQALDAVAAHLRTMPHRSKKHSDVNVSMLCAYRSWDGLSCAIGCLIDDDAEARRFDTLANGAIKELVYDHEIETELDTMFLSSLQRVHDNGENWGSNGFIGSADLDAVARKYGLRR